MSKSIQQIRKCCNCSTDFLSSYQETNPICKTCYLSSLSSLLSLLSLSSSKQTKIDDLSLGKLKISEKKLLIFDLNGLLVYRFRDGNKHKKKPDNLHDYKISKFKIWISKIRYQNIPFI